MSVGDGTGVGGVDQLHRGRKVTVRRILGRNRHTDFLRDRIDSTAGE
jgi:hypothetical protein